MSLFSTLKRDAVLSDIMVESAPSAPVAIAAPFKDSSWYTATNVVDMNGPEGYRRPDAYGSRGRDEIIGNEGDNVIRALGGDDRLIGGGGSDELWGGSGSDTFVYRSMHDSHGMAPDHAVNPGADRVRPDRIMDFEPGRDRIDLSAIDANVKQAGDQAFKLEAGLDLSNLDPNDILGRVLNNGAAPGEIRQGYDAARDVTVLTFNDGQSTSAIEVDGNHRFTAGDFVL